LLGVVAQGGKGTTTAESLLLPGELCVAGAWVVGAPPFDEYLRFTGGVEIFSVEQFIASLALTRSLARIREIGRGNVAASIRILSSVVLLLVAL
jgi:hypothetical protein